MESKPCHLLLLCIGSMMFPTLGVRVTVATISELINPWVNSPIAAHPRLVYKSGFGS